MFLVAACGGTMPEIRPHAMPESARAAPFTNAYDAGKRHLLADRTGLAIVMFEKALAINPVSVAALNAIGAAYDELHRPEVAQMYYVKALSIESNSADTLNNMAVSAAIAGDQNTSSTLFARAASLDPNNPMIRENMQLAGLVPSGPLLTETPIMPEVIAAIYQNRPRIERTGLTEITLTLPATMIEATLLLEPVKLSPKPVAIRPSPEA